MRNLAYSSLYFGTVGGTAPGCVLIQKLAWGIWICDVSEESDVWVEVEVMGGMKVSVSDLYYVAV